MGPSEGLDPAQWAKRCLLVVGDLMLDEYLWGRVERISPEAPVQVVQVSSETAVLGGAGNVVRNLRSLGAAVSVAGVIGRDRTGQAIVDILGREGVDGSGVYLSPGRKTSRKTRVMAGHQHVVRLDRETSEPISSTQVERILDFARDGSDRFHGLILSDYAKGGLTPRLIRGLIDIFIALKKPVVVDPKGRSYRRYQGATVLTPNQREAKEALGLDTSLAEAADKADKLMALHQWSGLIITQGAQGLSLFRPSMTPLHLPARARQVFDVSGAGDTVAAVVGLGLASGWPWDQVARLANLAGGVVVGKVGTAALSVEELNQVLRPAGEEKIVSGEELLGAAARLKAEDKRIVFTNGCFDLLHLGHVHLLQRSKEQGEVLVVGLDDDASVARLKGSGRPIIDHRERARILAALDCVDYVTVFKTEMLPGLIADLKPDVLTKGANYRLDQVVGRQEVERTGGRVVLIPLSGALTTSGLLEKISNGGQ